jgi:hypothetical protein
LADLSYFDEDIESFDLSELGRVFNYAESKKYGDWWKTPSAKIIYKF